MEPPRRCAPRWGRAAPVALIALLLLIGLVADGGASTPSRSDLDRPATAAPTLDRSAPRPGPGRDERAAWDLASAPDRPGPSWTVMPISAALAALVLVLTVTPVTRAAPVPRRHRFDLRRRGPPSVLAL